MHIQNIFPFIKTFFIIFFSFIVLSVLIQTMHLSIKPNILIVSLLVFCFNFNFTNSITFLIVLSIIYGAISSEKIGWLLVVLNIPIFLYVMLGLFSTKKIGLYSIIFICLVSELAFEILLNLHTMDSVLIFQMFQGNINLIYLILNCLFTASIVIIINTLFSSLKATKYG